MWYLTIAVILVGALCVFDLILSLGVIRRLREQNETLARLSASHSAAADATVAVGQRVDDFTATTVAGTAVSRDRLDGDRLIGFFSPGCRPCEQQLPAFLEYAARIPGRVLAVVVSDPQRASEYTAKLAPVADVVVEADAGPLARAFGVTGFPALCLVTSDGVVVANGSAMAALPDLARA
jgi:hypothetical protein